MRTKLIFASAIAGIAALGLLNTPEQARAASSPLAVQVGVGEALSSSAKNEVGNTSLHVGASLNIGNGSTLFLLPGTQGLDFDENYSSGHGGHINVLGVTYANRISLIPKPAQGVTAGIVPYVGFGLGLFEDNVKANTSSGTVDATGARFGGKLIAGIKSNKGTAFEIDYIISGTSVGVRTDTINFSLGQGF